MMLARNDRYSSAGTAQAWSVALFTCLVCCTDCVPGEPAATRPSKVDVGVAARLFQQWVAETRPPFTTREHFARARYLVSEMVEKLTDQEALGCAASFRDWHIDAARAGFAHSLKQELLSRLVNRIPEELLIDVLADIAVDSFGGSYLEWHIASRGGNAIEVMYEAYCRTGSVDARATLVRAMQRAMPHVDGTGRAEGTYMEACVRSYRDRQFDLILNKEYMRPPGMSAFVSDKSKGATGDLSAGLFVLR